MWVCAWKTNELVLVISFPVNYGWFPSCKLYMFCFELSPFLVIKVCALVDICCYCFCGDADLWWRRARPRKTPTSPSIVLLLMWAPDLICCCGSIHSKGSDNFSYVHSVRLIQIECYAYLKHRSVRHKACPAEPLVHLCSCSFSFSKHILRSMTWPLWAPLYKMKCKVADTVTQITQINFFSIYATVRVPTRLHKSFFLQKCVIISLS